MSLRLLILTTLLLLLAPLQGLGEEIDEVRLKLIENQRNIIQLRQEKTRNEAELESVITLQTTNSSSELQRQAEQLQEEITEAGKLIQTLSTLTSQQRLDLLTLERGSPPSSLDIALNKALNSNLPELAKKLANNEAAHKDVARLQALLKEETQLGNRHPTASTSVSVLVDQQLAEEEFLTVLSLFSENEANNAADKVIVISGTEHQTPYVEEGILNYLGHHRYHMETTVHAGKMALTIDDRSWKLSITKKDHRATYVVIYDLSDEEKPRVVMFNKNLLLE